jgi:phosphoribosyl 1,2-cyclic phosphodiesterase
MELDNMVVKYWGVRGSIPAPLTSEQVREKQEALIRKVIEDGAYERLKEDPGSIQDYLETLPQSLSGTYGGNTTCIEVRARDSPLIVIDAGSGARELGNSLIGRLFSGQNLNPLNADGEHAREMHVFLTHYHWDHLQGFPFFTPAFVGVPGKQLDTRFYGKKDARKNLSDVLAGQQEYPNFPVVWEDMPCGKDYNELGRLNPHPVAVGNAQVSYQELTHPDSVFAYRVDANGKAFVCATDTEHKDIPDPRLVKLAKGADIMYYDGQYTPEEYSGEKGMPKVDWGHSTYEWGIRSALAAGVRAVVLGHHDPARGDFDVEAIAKRAEEYRDYELKKPENKGKELEVVMAYDGLEQRL